MSQRATPYFSKDRNVTDVIVGFIDRTVTSLDVAVYSLTHDRIAEALIRAHLRGVQVRVLMDDLQAASRWADDEKLRAASMEVRVDSSSGAMHNKYALSDGCALLTGSHNWTAAADDRNAENMLIVRLKYIAEAYTANFERLWETTS